MANDKIYVGSGVEKFNGGLIEISICMDQIPQEWIFEYNGKKYLKLKVQKKKQPDNYGKTHSVEINTYKPVGQNSGQSNDPEDNGDGLPF